MANRGDASVFLNDLISNALAAVALLLIITLTKVGVGYALGDEASPSEPRPRATLAPPNVPGAAEVPIETVVVLVESNSPGLKVELVGRDRVRDFRESKSQLGTIIVYAPPAGSRQSLVVSGSGILRWSVIAERWRVVPWTESLKDGLLSPTTVVGLCVDADRRIHASDAMGSELGPCGAGDG